MRVIGWVPWGIDYMQEAYCWDLLGSIPVKRREADWTEGEAEQWCSLSIKTSANFMGRMTNCPGSPRIEEFPKTWDWGDSEMQNSGKAEWADHLTMGSTKAKMDL